jgi:hypothetical protein
LQQPTYINYSSCYSHCCTWIEIQTLSLSWCWCFCSMLLLLFSCPWHYIVFCIIAISGNYLLQPPNVLCLCRIIGCGLPIFFTCLLSLVVPNLPHLCIIYWVCPILFKCVVLVSPLNFLYSCLIGCTQSFSLGYVLMCPILFDCVIVLIVPLNVLLHLPSRKKSHHTIVSLVRYGGTQWKSLRLYWGFGFLNCVYYWVCPILFNCVEILFVPLNLFHL